MPAILSMSQERYPLTRSRTRSRRPCSLSNCSRQLIVLERVNGYLSHHRRNGGNLTFPRGVGYLCAGPSAVGNSRRVHRDVSNVSCTQVPDASRGTELTIAGMIRSYFRLSLRRATYSESSSSIAGSSGGCWYSVSSCFQIPLALCWVSTAPASSQVSKFRWSVRIG